MRILHVLSQVELTGSEAYAKVLVDDQSRSGHEVFIVSDKIHLSFSGTFQSFEISTSSFWKRMFNILQLRSFIIKNKIDVIHCHSRAACRHAYWARLFTKTALISTLHGRQHFSWSKRLFDIYGSFVIAICENLKKSLVQDFKMSHRKIRVIRNSIQIENFSFLEELPTDPYLGIVGRSSGPKGQRIKQLIEECLDVWLANISNLKIDIITPHPEKFGPECLKILTELQKKYPDRLQLLGHISHLAEQLKSYTAVIGAGRIAMESLLRGRATFVLGEYAYEGLVRPPYFPQVLQSNFGDIGSEKVFHDYSSMEIIDDVLLFFKKDIHEWKNERNTLRSLIEKETSPQHVCSEIMEVYKAALFRLHHPDWIPVLMYHKIPESQIQSPHRIFVTKEKFEEHLEFFVHQKRSTLWFSELKEFWDLKRPYSEFPKRPLILTFDDGYKDNLTNALPLLEKYKMKANIFLLADHTITENTWDQSGEPLMTLEEKQKLVHSAFEIGSHGFNHARLTELSDDEILDQMKSSKEKLEKDLGIRVTTFAYPFGSTSPHIADLCKEAGYSFAVNTDTGGMDLPENPHSIFRVNIFPEDGPMELWKKTEPWYRKYFFNKRGH
ncbi:MAG: polysaccharide deacetylase [Oligoflexia bacterium]|nr:MAG: polysaccharide deacetylase [Oligoflexia bacterium]